MGEKGNPLDFLQDLPSTVLQNMPQLTEAYREWRTRQEAEATAEASPASSDTPSTPA